jgi:hypothetical protein
VSLLNTTTLNTGFGGSMKPNLTYNEDFDSPVLDISVDSVKIQFVFLKKV